MGADEAGAKSVLFNPYYRYPRHFHGHAWYALLPVSREVIADSLKPL
ncbi:MAG: hypothetical protein CM15mP120_06480 [Pseudomonadota bacterium]|nr:MAG: hypothetical protein CM15mP120_06480 [Pseudomonadota bacterium]